MEKNDGKFIRFFYGIDNNKMTNTFNKFIVTVMTAVKHALVKYDTFELLQVLKMSNSVIYI